MSEKTKNTAQAIQPVVGSPAELKYGFQKPGDVVWPGELTQTTDVESQAEAEKTETKPAAKSAKKVGDPADIRYSFQKQGDVIW